MIHGFNSYKIHSIFHLQFSSHQFTQFHLHCTAKAREESIGIKSNTRRGLLLITLSYQEDREMDWHQEIQRRRWGETRCSDSDQQRAEPSSRSSSNLKFKYEFLIKYFTANISISQIEMLYLNVTKFLCFRWISSFLPTDEAVPGLTLLCL